MTPETPHGAAVALADVGWSVFPTHEPDPHPCGCSCRDEECASPGKHPRVSRGLHRATRDFDALDSWWTCWPGAGVGVATGDPSGVFVLDVDGAKGAESLAEFPRLPETVEGSTGRGFHIYLAMPDDADVRNSAGQVGPGLDVRGTGGYVIAPPSRHVSGRTYRWTHDPFHHDVAAAPAWLLDLVVKEQHETFPEPREIRPVGSRRYIEKAVELECLSLATAPEGTRNDTLNRSAFALARFADEADVGAIRDALRIAARAAGLRSHETENTLDSAFRARGAP